MPGVRVDGNDALAVRDSVAQAVDRARAGHGPTLIEAMTYRWLGHYSGDAGGYMPSEELAYWREERDPLLPGIAALSDGARADIDERVRLQVEGALAFAMQSPPADAESLRRDSWEMSQ